MISAELELSNPLVGSSSKSILGLLANSCKSVLGVVLSLYWNKERKKV